METENFLSANASPMERKQEVSLRPTKFSEFIGQKRVIENIEIMVQSAKKRQEAMDHALLSGPPGLGKTSLAMLVAHELGSELHTVSGPAIEKKGDLAAVLTNLEPNDVLFIDEIHRMHISVEEILYSAMEDFRLDILIGQGASARTMQIELPPFTLIGATTRSGLLSSPLRDRFLAHLNFDFYSPAEIGKIIKNNCQKLSVDILDNALAQMASRSRGTPRIANRILRRVRDYSIVKEVSVVSEAEVIKSLNLMDIDDLGLDSMDRKILKVINEFYNNGPVGIEALCATLNEDRGTIEDVYEPYLLKQGLLLRTSRGRCISNEAVEHITQD